MFVAARRSYTSVGLDPPSPLAPTKQPHLSQEHDTFYVVNTRYEHEIGIMKALIDGTDRRQAIARRRAGSILNTSEYMCRRLS